MNYTRDDAGHPLGHGMPTGRSLRLDGESHRDAWMRILRDDPCSYCGVTPAGTVDHIEPRSRPAKGHGGVHTWANFAAACEHCNQRKGARPLLIFLAVRRSSTPIRRALCPPCRHGLTSRRQCRDVPHSPRSARRPASYVPARIAAACLWPTDRSTICGSAPRVVR